MEKQELKYLLANHTQKQVSEILNISQSTLSRLIREYKLQRKNYHPNKLSLKEAKEIRVLYERDDYTQQKLAKKYNVTQGTINKIVNNYTYKKNKDMDFGGKATVQIGYKL